MVVASKCLEKGTWSGLTGVGNATTFRSDNRLIGVILLL